MKILVINSGSSSLKYQVIDMETNEMLVKGNYERIGQAGSFLTHKVQGVKRKFEHEVKNHEEAIQFIISRIYPAIFYANCSICCNYCYRKNTNAK